MNIDNNNKIIEHEVLPWSEYFNTGLIEIDKQHERWVELLNLLASHSNNKANHDVLDTVFNELFAYTKYHFETEEAIWQTYFPQDDWELKHHLVHERFITELCRLKDEKNNTPLEQVVDDILAFLIPWLAHHILVSDKRMAGIVLAVQSGLTLEAAKKQSDKQIANYQPDEFSF